MRFYIARILKNRAKYLAMIVIIGFVFVAIFELYNILPDIYKEIHPEYVFDIENVYELKTLQNNHSLLGVKGKHIDPIVFNEDFIRELENIEGVRAACLSSVFTPEKEVYTWPINDTIKNFLRYELGDGFDRVLQMEVFPADISATTASKIYIEKPLKEKLEELGLTPNDLAKKENINYSISGTFNEIGIKSYKKVDQLLGICNITEANKALVRLSGDADIEQIKSAVFNLIVGKYNADKTVIEFYPLNIYGKQQWYNSKNQIITFFIIGIILLLYIILALLGIYWNETNSRNAEIGLMRAIGFSKSDIFFLFIKEASLVSLVSIILSTILIINIHSAELNSVSEFLKTILLNSIITLLIVWISIFIPAVKASKVQPAVALSEE